MLLLTGGAGSGKTFQVLQSFREALRANESAARLLVPTATMAQHVQNRLAREGIVLRPSAVQTLSRFVDSFGTGLNQVPDSVLYLIVEESVRRVDRPEFARVAHLAGFSASLARTIQDLSSAGCDSERLARHLPDAPLAEPFLAVYREVDRELARRGLLTRSARLERLASRIYYEGLGGIQAIWLDGFHALPDPELAVIEAMTRHAEITLTLPAQELTPYLRKRLLAMRFREQPCRFRSPEPRRELVEAPTIERECDEIAARILDSGVAFRDVGIIVRSAEIYEPVLHATLERFGIPARFYFDSDLDQHAITRFLGGAVDAMLGGWDHSQTLTVLRLAPGLSTDYFDFEVRKRIPARGLAGLEELSGANVPLRAMLEKFAALEQWRRLSLPGTEWALRTRELRSLYPIRRPAGDLSHDDTAMLRATAAVLDAFDQAIDEAASFFDSARPLRFEEFWRSAKSVIRLTPLRLDDRRRNVVSVLGAHEARQWRLPFVFVCGLVEKQFPRFHTPDPFFPESARIALRAAGFRVRTAEEFERDEELLFESAISRGSSEVVLTYPRSDERGERNLRSLFIDGLPLPACATEPVQPERTAEPRWRAPVAVRAEDLRLKIAERAAAVSPTALEEFLQCPFLFYGRRVLKLEEPPDRPSDRLNFLRQGNIVHDVLAALTREPQPLEPLFDRIFAETCARDFVPSGYRTESLRHQMLEDIGRFLADARWPSGFTTRAEQEFSYDLGGVKIRGRIDRIEVGKNGEAYVIDYKYSNAQNAKNKVKDETVLQAPLYMLAAERQFGLDPAGMFYIGLRGEVQYSGWTAGDFPIKAQPLSREMIDSAVERSLAAVAEIRGGRIAPDPRDRKPCEYCSYRDVCRFEAAAAQGVAQ